MTARKLRFYLVIAVCHNSENLARTKGNRATEDVVGQSAKRNLDVPYHAIAFNAAYIVTSNITDSWKSFDTTGGAASDFCRRLIFRVPMVLCPTTLSYNDGGTMTMTTKRINRYLRLIRFPFVSLIRLSLADCQKKKTGSSRRRCSPPPSPPRRRLWISYNLSTSGRKSFGRVR